MDKWKTKTGLKDPHDHDAGQEAKMEDEWFDNEGEQGKCFLVMIEGSYFRTAWSWIINWLVAYTGTVFLYRICFVEFHVTERADMVHEWNDYWRACDMIINILFTVDLFINFFFSYTDRFGSEVVSLPRIAKEYLTGDFSINFISSFPWAQLQVALSGPVHQTVRIARIPRLTRILRLAKLKRVVNAIAAASISQNSFLSFLHRYKGIKIITDVVALLFVVHLLACGWYLTAALHLDPEDTWLARRFVDKDGQTTLLGRGSAEAWIHSMYFVLTVFTTVGFGDISAITPGEIVYVSFTMLVGCVVHGIIISQVITLVTSADHIEEFVQQQRQLVGAFASHTRLDERVTRRLHDWVRYNASSWVGHHFDRARCKELITTKLPQGMLELLPSKLFKGHLLKNNYLLMGGTGHDVPAHLPVLMALSMQEATFRGGQIIYKMSDFPSCMFLIQAGTFACIALPTKEGGLNPFLHRANFNIDTSGACGSTSHHTLEKTTTGFSNSEKHYPYKLFSARSYFGEAEILLGCCRRCTLRCESSSGSVLVLQAEDVEGFVREFPQFGSRWRQESFRRERHRERLLGQLFRGLTHRHFAARRIQQIFRARLSGTLRATAQIRIRAQEKQEKSLATQTLEAVKSLQSAVATLKADVSELKREQSEQLLVM